MAEEYGDKIGLAVHFLHSNLEVVEERSGMVQSEFHHSLRETTKCKLPAIELPTFEEVNNGMIFTTEQTNVLHSMVGEDSLLPTFSCQIVKEHNQQKILAMIDTGSQGSFVTEDLAKQYALKVVRSNVLININGINCQKSYSTKVVEIELQMKNTTIRIHALCLPEIATSLNLRKVAPLAKLLHHKGYLLAHHDLINADNGNGEISCIIGTDFQPYLKMSPLIFGRKEEKSLCYNSPYGIILSGRISHMIRNIDFLPTVNKENVDEFREIFKQNIGFKGKSTPNGKRQAKINVLSILNDSGDINDSIIEKATQDILVKEYKTLLDMNYEYSDNQISDLNESIINFLLENWSRNKQSGRLQLPLIWNAQTKHMLGYNFNLSLKILKCSVNKLKKNSTRLRMYDQVFKDQLKEGILEQIYDLPEFLRQNENSISFIAHTGVYRMSHETTKCRVVYLSNLCERMKDRRDTYTHNQCSLPGPNLNHKLYNAMLLLRFDKYLLTFDLKKAYLQIEIPKEDSNRLVLLWYSDVMLECKKLIAFRCRRVPFGNSCSPLLLMFGLYVMLVVNAENDEPTVAEIKKHMYDLAYMDNLGYTTDSEEDLKFAYEVAKEGH